MIGALLNLIPIVGPIVLMGWHCEIIQRLCKRQPQPIPKLDLSDFGHYLGRGVAPFVVMLIATLPITFVVIVGMFVIIFGIGLVAQQGMDPPLLLVGGIGLGVLLFFALILPLNALLTAALLRAELTEDIGKSLDFGKILAFFKRTWKDFVIAYLVMIPIAFLIMIGGMLVFFVGIYAAIILMNIAYLHMRWQVYERYLARGGEPIPIQTKSGPVPSEARLAALAAAQQPVSSTSAE